MRTFIVVPQNILLANLFLTEQDKLKKALQVLLANYDTRHQIGVVQYLGSALTDVWSTIDEHVWSKTSVLYQTYSIIREIEGDHSLVGILSGHVTIAAGFMPFSIPVIGKAETTYIRRIAYNEPVLFRLASTGRKDVVELTIFEREVYPENTTLFQELKFAIENFVR